MIKFALIRVHYSMKSLKLYYQHIHLFPKMYNEKALQFPVVSSAFADYQFLWISLLT